MNEKNYKNVVKAEHETLRFFKCEVCGNTVLKLYESGAPMICCGREMKLLIPNSTEANALHHIPVIDKASPAGTDCYCKSVKVRIGEDPHPMEEYHYIRWVVLHTNKAVHQVNLKPGDKPEVVFCLEKDEEPITAYAFCNQHSLWASGMTN